MQGKFHTTKRTKWFARGKGWHGLWRERQTQAQMLLGTGGEHHYSSRKAQCNDARLRSDGGGGHLGADNPTNMSQGTGEMLDGRV